MDAAFLDGATWLGAGMDEGESGKLRSLLVGTGVLGGSAPGKATGVPPSPPGTSPGIRPADVHVLNRGGDLIVSGSYPAWDWVLVLAADKGVVLSAFRMAYFTALGLGIVALVIIWLAFLAFARKVTMPLSELTELARSLGAGDFLTLEGIHLVADRSTGDEIIVLAREFESMARRLGSLTQGLEERVAARTEELERSNAGLTDAIRELKATQDQLVAAEKLASLGQLVASVAHELNTPIAAMISACHDTEASMEPLLGILDLYRGLDGPEAGLLRRLVAAGGNGRSLPSHAEERKVRMAITRRLSASAISGSEAATIAGLADLLVEIGAELPDSGEDLRLLLSEQGRIIVEAAWTIAGFIRSVGVMGLAADKAAQVVRSLKIFSRQEEKAPSEPLDIREEIDEVLVLFRGVMKSGVEVERLYSEVPPVLGWRDSLDQVWINLVDNALHAMDYKGRLVIMVRPSGGMVEVSVKDSGPGMTEAVQARIFTPFFTTKKSGEGTGLGLSISRRIVEETGGTVGFRTGPEGTTFTVLLPAAGP